MRIALCVLFSFLPIIAFAETPETVLVTFHPAPGKEAEVEALIWQQWETVTRLHFTANDVHHLYRAQSETGGQTVLIDSFTWKNGDIPDHAPPEILAIWKKMNAAVVKPGIEILAIEEVQKPSR